MFLLKKKYIALSSANRILQLDTPQDVLKVDISFLSSVSQAVERWLVDRAVLPIENSLGGSIHRNYDLLLRHRLHIVGEVKYAVRHCLLANHGVKVEDLKRVLSHPQVIVIYEVLLN